MRNLFRYQRAGALLTILLCASLNSFAQNESDVQRYSTKYMLGTARFNALGGAMGSLGGDMSAIHINPAGLGVYRFSDISFTPAVETNTIDGEIGDINSSDSKTRFVVNNAGLVLANELNHPHWKMLNVSFSYQRNNTFNDRLVLNSSNPVEYSLMQDFVDEANGYYVEELSEFGALLAWEGYVIDTLADGLSYEGRVVSGDMNQYQTATRKGNTSDFSFSLGANYNDKLYIGAGFGIQSVKYDLEIETTETPTIQSGTDLANYRFTELLTTDGYGVDFKVGAILKLGNFLRVGGSIQTPTTFLLTDNFQNKLNSRLVNPDEHIKVESSIGVFEYRVRTPWRYMASISGIYKKRALLSVQYEYANISSGKLKNSKGSDGANADFSNENHLIATNFEGQHTLRTGLELRASKEFYFRFGFAYFTNFIPANEFTDANLDRLQYSGGLGYKTAGWSLDLSYQLSTFDELYYTNTQAQLATLSNKVQSIALTFGLRI